MPIYDRIKLEITDISPESASKVFQFLYVLLDEQFLDLKYFKNHISNYSIGEQYFILKYAKAYFNDNEKSYLNIWLKNYNLVDQINIDNKIFDLIHSNYKKINNYIETNQKTIERQFKFYKKNEFDYSNVNAIRYKIPLHSLPNKVKFDGNLKPGELPIFIGKTDEEKTKIENYIIEKKSDYLLKFQTEVFKLLTDIFNENQIDKLFHNSFALGESGGFPTYLNLEFKDSKKLYGAFFDIYQLYNSEENTTLRGGQILEQKKQNKELKRVRKKFTPKILNKKITKLEVMKVMYNAFPQIRDSYKNFTTQKSSTTLNAYLLTKSRNIKKV